VDAVRALDGRPVGRCARGLRDRLGARDRELRVDPQDVQDRLRLEVERRRALARFEILRTPDAACPCTRNVWSRSLPRSVTVPSRPNRSAILATSSALKLGGISSRTDFTRRS
jgi:hypothetical protein